MKSPFASVSAATILAASLILAAGLSPAQATTEEIASTSAPATSTSVVDAGTPAPEQDVVASTYGMAFLPCTMFGIRWC